MKKIFFILLSAFTFSSAGAQKPDDVQKDMYYENYESAKAKLLQMANNQEVSPDVWYWLGEIYLQQGKTDSAALVYQQHAAADLQKEYSKKESPLVYIGWAHVLLDSGKADEAKAQIIKILEESKYKNAEALHAAARAYLESKNGDLNQAIQWMDQAIKRDKKNPALYTTLGDIYRKQVDGSNAIRNYDMALEEDGNYAEAMYKEGKIYKTQNSDDIYLDKFLKAYELDSTYGPNLLELYKYYYFKDVSKADQYLEQYFRHTDYSPEQDYMRTDLYYASRKFKDAINEAQKIIAREKDTVQPRLYKLIAYSDAALGDSMMALENMNRYFEKQDTADYVAKDYVLKAKLLEKLSTDTNQVVDNYKEALRIEKEDKEKLDYYTKLAYLESKRNNDSAEAYWRGKIYETKPDPTNLDIYKWGMALYQSRNFQMADSVFGLYEAKYPDQVYGPLYRAKANTFIDTTMQLGLAVPHYQRLIEVAGKDSVKNKNLLTLAYEYLGAYEATVTKRYAASLKYFDKVLELDPGNEDAVRNTAILKKWIDEGKGEDEPETGKSGN